MRSRTLARAAAVVLAAAGLAGCAYQNGPGDAVVVPPPPELADRFSWWYYVPCVTPTGCDVGGQHYALGDVVPLPTATP